MKTKLLSLCITFAFLSANGQIAIPNPNFESWTQNSIENLMYFQENSNYNCYRENLGTNVSKITPSYQGQYAIELKTIDHYLAYFINTDAKEGNMPAWTNGMAYSGQPTGISGYYKYNVATADSALIVLIFRKNSTVIGEYMFKIGGVKTEFTLFDFDFNPALTQTPDSLIFCMVSSDFMKNENGVNGSTLVVDNVLLKGVVQQPVELNGDFENWEITNMPPKIDDWDVNDEGFERTSDAQKGEYALKLTTYEGEENGQATARPGYLSSGYWDDNCGCLKGGYPFSNMKDTLALWYKYSPQNGDKAQVSLSFKKNGSQFEYREVTLNSSAAYTYMELPFQLGTIPDTVIVQAISSLWTNKDVAYLGSTLILDNLYFKSSLNQTGITNVHQKDLCIYPTIVSKEIFLLNTNNEVQKISILDVSGKRVACFETADYKINTANFRPGVYLLTVCNKDKNRHFRFIKIQE